MHPNLDETTNEHYRIEIDPGQAVSASGPVGQILDLSSGVVALRSRGPR